MSPEAMLVSVYKFILGIPFMKCCIRADSNLKHALHHLQQEQGHCLKQTYFYSMHDIAAE